MDNPLVSVVIPAYNCADVIGETLASVACQTYGNIEAVIVDDGSSDETGKVIDGFQGKGKVEILPPGERRSRFRQEHRNPGGQRGVHRFPGCR